MELEKRFVIGGKIVTRYKEATLVGCDVYWDDEYEPTFYLVDDDVVRGSFTVECGNLDRFQRSRAGCKRFR